MEKAIFILESCLDIRNHMRASERKNSHPYQDILRYFAYCWQ